MRKTWYDDTQWSFNDVKTSMLKHYVNKYRGDIIRDGQRKLGVIETTDTIGSKIIYFTLNGSPPKGHATWIESKRLLTLFDPHYDVWRVYYLERGLTP